MLIAITGNIGSGKSLVSQLLRVMGYPVYDCDSRAKALMIEDSNLRAALISVFGEDTYLADGTLNKPHLSSMIFQNPDMRDKMNALIHPAVARDLFRVSPHPDNQNYILNFFESAILYESHFDELSHPDYVISVSAPLDLRIARITARDHATPTQIQARINSQLPQEEKDHRADFVIINDNTHSVIQQLETVIKALC